MNSRILSIASSLLCASFMAQAEPGDVSWELLRPSNTGIPGDYTQVIYIDDDDSPWIAGYIPFWEEGGMAHLEGNNLWRVLNNVDCPQIGQEIGSPRFSDLVRTDDGVMWIGTGRGLLRFDPSQDEWCVTKYTTANSGIAGNSVNALSIAPDGTIWMGCDTWGGGPDGGLSQYDPATDTWNSWDTSNGLPWWAGWDDVDYVAVQEDASGGYTVWFGSSTMGMTTYKDGLFIWYGSPTPPPSDPLPTGMGGKNPVLPNGDMLLTTDEGIAFRHPDGTYSIVGGYPAGAISELASQHDVKVIPISCDDAPKICEEFKFFAEDTVPGGTYEGNADDVTTLSVGAQWITSAERPEDLIYEITKALWNDNPRKQLDAGHAKGKLITKDTALNGIGVPLHPGAEKFYKEAGLLQ